MIRITTTSTHAYGDDLTVLHVHAQAMLPHTQTLSGTWKNTTQKLLIVALELPKCCGGILQDHFTTQAPACLVSTESPVLAILFAKD